MRPPRLAPLLAGGVAALRLLLPAALLAGEREVGRLQLERALPIESEYELDPSGLARLDGRLLAVSDKHDDLVFELVERDHDALAIPAIHFAPPPGGEPHRLDLEGIAAGAGGVLFLASEGTSRVLAVDPGGSRASWITPDLRPLAAASGLLAKPNAGLEGIAVRGGGGFYLAAEREPRGILAVSTSGGRVGVRAVACERTGLPRPRPRAALDFADLGSEGETLWALVRNADAVCRLDAASGTFAETRCWSFAGATLSPELVYQDTTFGMAEGLSLDAERIYIVLDNNREPRAADPDDCRPLLLVFTRPADMK